MAAVRTTAELREGFQAFFEEKSHLRCPSASLIPRADDRSTLLTSAGMQPQMPYFLGLEPPPGPLTTTCQKVFRTVDIDTVGLDTFHLWSAAFPNAYEEDFHADEAVVVEGTFHGTHPLLANCLRLTVGTPDENSRMLDARSNPTTGCGLYRNGRDSGFVRRVSSHAAAPTQSHDSPEL